MKEGLGEVKCDMHFCLHWYAQVHIYKQQYIFATQYFVTLKMICIFNLCVKILFWCSFMAREKTQKKQHTLCNFDWSESISIEIHHLPHSRMGLDLHSGPSQMCLSASQLSKEEPLGFEFESVDVWKSADSHNLNRDRRKGGCTCQIQYTTHTHKYKWLMESENKENKAWVGKGLRSFFFTQSGCDGVSNTWQRFVPHI